MSVVHPSSVWSCPPTILKNQTSVKQAKGVDASAFLLCLISKQGKWYSFDMVDDMAQYYSGDSFKDATGQTIQDTAGRCSNLFRLGQMSEKFARNPNVSQWFVKWDNPSPTSKYVAPRSPLGSLPDQCRTDILRLFLRPEGIKGICEFAIGNLLLTLHGKAHPKNAVGVPGIAKMIDQLLLEGCLTSSRCRGRQERLLKMTKKGEAQVLGAGVIHDILPSRLHPSVMYDDTSLVSSLHYAYDPSFSC